MIYWEGSKFNMMGSMTVCEIVTTAAPPLTRKHIRCVRINHKAKITFVRNQCFNRYPTMELVLVQMLHYTLSSTTKSEKKRILRPGLQRNILVGNLYMHVGILGCLKKKKGTLPYLPNI